MKVDKTEVLTLLRESSDYVSGQELCDRYNVSRTAVWKLIKQLQDAGYEIEAVQNKGYKLVTSPDILSQSEIASSMQTEWAGRNLIYLESTGSTNTDVKRMAEEGAPHGTLVVAGEQKSGRGRRGRVWQSPPGTSMYMSLLLKPDIAPDKASMLTLVIAHSMVKAIRQETGLEASIKWPNDILVGGKKISGILTEMNVETDYIQYVVIGVGINANNKAEDFPEEIRETASSLMLQKGQPIKRAALIGKIMEQFEQDYALFLETCDLSGLMDSYNEMMVNLGKQVRVLDPKGEYEGVAKGILATGELLVEKKDGTMEAVYAGEVSVRGIYGYV